MLKVRCIEAMLYAHEVLCSGLGLCLVIVFGGLLLGVFGLLDPLLQGPLLELEDSSEGALHWLKRPFVVIE